MSLFVTVSVSVEGPDDQTLVLVTRTDTTINADPGSAAGETAVALSLLERLGVDTLEAAAARLTEFGAVLEGYIERGD